MNDSAPPLAQRVLSPADGRATVRLFLLFFLPLAALLSLAAFLFYDERAQNEKALYEARELQRVTKREKIIAAELQAAASDLRVLADEIGLHLRSGSPASAQPILRDEFLSFTKRKAFYREICFLDLSGQEVIRVDRRHGRPRAVPPEELESEAGHAHFREALRLGRGEIYISPFQFTAEESPQPELRFAQMAHDRQGQRRGVIVITYDAARLVRELQTATPAAPGDDMLFNADGSLVYGTDPSCPQSVCGQDIWKRIQAVDSGQLSYAGGLITFATVYPLLEGMERSSARAAAPAAAKKHFWKVVSHVSGATLTAESRELAGKLLPHYLGLLALFAAGSWFGAHAAAKHRNAEERLFHEALARLELTRGVEQATATLQSIGDAVITVNTDGRIVSLNPAAERISGWSNAEAQGRVFQDVCRLIDEGSRQPVECPAKKCMSEKAVVSLPDSVVMVSRDGREFAVQDTAAPIHTRLGQIIGAVQVFRDVSERRRAEQELQQAQERLRAVVDGVLDGIVTFDEQGMIESFNPAAGRMFGYQPQEVVGRNSSLLLADPECGEHDNCISRYVGNGEAKTLGKERETTGRRKDGALFPMEISLNEVRVEGQRRFIGILRDITERKEAEQQLVFLAQYDQLTGLANRTLFLDHLRQALARAQRNGQMAAVMFIDLDDFKEINDTLGHDIGDQVLKQVAERLKSCVRVSDVVARMGGDEFTIVLEGLEKREYAELAAQNILKAMLLPLAISQRELKVATSIGIALYPDDGEDIGALLRNADIAMYRSKAGGGNAYHFYAAEMARNSGKQ